MELRYRSLKYIFTICSLFALSFTSIKSQVSVPLTNSDLDDIIREQSFMKSMGIDLSQTWLFMVKDNMISSNKLLVSEISYNNAGMPFKMFFFDENNKISNFTIVKYNNNNLPFEEIRFSADSSLINGIMYEYDESNLLKKQYNYNNKSEIISVFDYDRQNDSIYITEFDGNQNIKSTNLICLTKGNLAKIKKIVKLDGNNNQIEKQEFEYDEMSSLRKKNIFENGIKTGYKEFVYNDEGALIKSSYLTNDSELINSTSYEYDNYGNIIRIIERSESDNSTKVFVINYLSKSNN
ncbi:MAG: hypothetical protein JXR36_10150 [Bacteroidales bacterium]|nr:hypothetical protein [Bacteroidales bacterium]